MMTKEEVAQVIAYCDENNREALRELLPGKCAKQTNLVKSSFIGGLH